MCPTRCELPFAPEGRGFITVARLADSHMNHQPEAVRDSRPLQSPPAGCSLTDSERVDLCERLANELETVRHRITYRDCGCWDEYLELIAFRFRSSDPGKREMVNRIAALVDPLILEAAREDALECLESLHQAGCPLEGFGDQSQLLIHIAAHKGADRVIAWLIDEEICTVDARTTAGLTALHYAAFAGRVSTVQVLLDRAAFVDAASSSGETPLHAAIRNGTSAVVSLLVEAGANLGATVNGEQTPLSIAALYRRNGFCVRLLLSRGAPWAHALPEILAIHGTSILDEPPLAQVRLEGCPQDRLGHLFTWIRPEQAHVLLERGARPSNAAEHALRNREYALLQLIKQYGDFRYGESHYKSAAASILGMTQLLQQGGDPNVWVTCKTGARVPLIYYVAIDNRSEVETISLLLRHGADPTVPPDSALAPLLSELLKHSRCSIDLLRTLVAHGTDVNAEDYDGCRPVHRLLTSFWTNDCQHLLEALLRHGADANVQDPEGLTPLMLAANLSWAGAPERTAALLRAGARIDSRDALGRTALHHMFESPERKVEVNTECQAVLDLLLHSGADIFAQDHRGRYAEDLGDCACVERERATVGRLRQRMQWGVNLHRSSTRALSYRP